MRLEKKKEAEIARRQGSTKKTLLQGTWLILSFGIAYFLIGYLEDSDIISVSQLATQLQLPSSVPEGVVFGGLMCLSVIFLQFFVMIGFLVASPQGRQASGKPTAHSRNVDPYDNPYEN